MAVRHGIVYGDSARQQLDVYRPRKLAAPAPVVVFLYGGRWQQGERDEYRLVGTALTRRGFVVVVPDYRLYPAVKFPRWVEDAALAVRWTHEHIRAYGGDPEQVVVVGHSAGAHSAVLLAMDERYLRNAGVPAGTVRGFVSLAGPVDTVWTAPDVQALMGPRDLWPTTYPANYIDGNEPPLLLLHGKDDETVRTGNSVEFARRVEQAGGCARAVLYPDVGHISLMVAVAAPWLGKGAVLNEIAAFVREPRRVCGVRTAVVEARNAGTPHSGDGNP